jgi:hypothetical protein
LSTLASAGHASDKTMAIEHGVDGAACWNFDFTGKATQQAFVDLARASVRLIPFEAQDANLQLLGQLVALTTGFARASREGFQTTFFAAFKDLVAGFARDRELAAERSHFLSSEQASDKANTLVHNRTPLPRHPHPYPFV